MYMNEHNPANVTVVERPVDPILVAKAKRQRHNIVVLILFSLAIAGAFIYYLTLPALKIGNLKISKKQYNLLVAQAKDQKVPEKDIKQQIIDLEKQKIVADETKIKVQDSDITAAAKKIYGKLDGEQINEWQNLNGFSVALENEINLQKNGYVTGAVMMFPFTRNLESSDPNESNPTFNKPEAVQDDKNYAMKKAKEFRKRLVDNKTPVEELIGEIKNDDRLVFGSSGNTSTTFRVANAEYDKYREYTSNEITAYKFMKYIKGYNDGRATDILTYQSILMQQNDKKPTETAYFVVQLVRSANAVKDLDANFNTALRKVKVVTHV